MITWIYDSTKTMHHSGDALCGEDVTGYCLGSDMESPPLGMPNGAKMYIMDWAELDDAAKAAAGAQVLLFDGDGLRWLPQGGA